MLDAILSGALDRVPMRAHPVFQTQVPQHCPGVPDEMLDPRGMWADKGAYDATAARLAALFNENFQKFSDASPAIREAAPAVRYAA
jgi:phosphoenolpyruvate carboxykinase (ATP)